MSAGAYAEAARGRIKTAAAVKNGDSADTLAFVAIRDGEAWKDRRLPEVGRALTQALAEIDALSAALELAREVDYIAPAVLADAPGLAEGGQMSTRVNHPGLNDYARESHKANVKWWQTSDGAALERNKGELLMLMVSEIAEAMEGERKGLMDDKLPHRSMAEVELADTLIRIFDYAGAFGYDLEGAYREKLAYNATREDHEHEVRELAGGKKW